jgi:flavorubredoxin
MKDDKILKVAENVSWIGVLDPDIVTFDVVMETKYGTTYNSYFINAEKKTIVETVKEKFWDTYLGKIRNVIDPKEIEYIILNHTEPDHSGCLEKLLKLAPKAKVIASGNGIRYLKDLLGFEFPHQVVKDGESLDLGDRKIQFIAAPNLHWPDSMMSYLWEERLLFTCDIFGEHYCDKAMFDDLVGDIGPSFKYYFDVIMKPYSKFMLQAIEKIRPVRIDTICTGHGVILRQDWKKYVNLTEQYALEALANPKPDAVFLAYVSAYGNTGLVARKIAEGIRAAGKIEVDVCDIEKVNIGTIEQKVIRSAGIILGCPTFNQNILLPIYQVFAVINPIRDRGKLAAAFGSYGWSGEGNKIINSNFSSLKLKLHDEGLLVKFTPHKEALERAFEYGKAFGVKLLEGQ